MGLPFAMACYGVMFGLCKIGNEVKSAVNFCFFQKYFLSLIKPIFFGYL